jgi:hypothetical protein
MERSMLRSGSAFNGFTLEASDGKVGTVSDFLFDDSNWQLRWLVVDTGAWLTGRKILIHPSALEKPDLAGRAFPVKLTRAQVEGSPEIGRDEPVSLQMEHNLYGYYGYDVTWGGGFAGGNGTAVPTTAGTSVPVSKGDPHLRSIAEVSGYGIHAIDGDIGHLDRFLIDDQDWTVRYLVVDTATWWLGKHVLVAPTAIKEISWAERFLRLDLTCYKIKGSPVWDQSGIVDRAYEQLLRIYYGWDGAAEQAAPAKAEPEKVHA